MQYGLITEQSRKAKQARSIYEYLKNRTKPQEWQATVQWESVHAVDGIRVPSQDRHRIVNLRLLDEHLSPYFRTDMNLFQMMMMDDKVDTIVYKADHGWLFVFSGIPSGPQPFGQEGYDTR